MCTNNMKLTWPMRNQPLRSQRELDYTGSCRGSCWVCQASLWVCKDKNIDFFDTNMLVSAHVGGLEQRVGSQDQRVGV